MTNINRSLLLPSIDSFQSSIPLTSTPKRSTKSSHSQPLSSTLAISTNTYEQMDLSISAITLSKKSSTTHQKRRRRTALHSGKGINLKYLLYATRAMKQREVKRSHHNLKVYLI